MLTIKKVNKAIKEAGFDNVELCRGIDYYYFWPTSDERHWLDCCGNLSVCVPTLNSMTLAQWLEAIKQLHINYLEGKNGY